MLITTYNFIFACINLWSVYKIYWPYIVTTWSEKIGAVRFLHSILQSWQRVLIVYMFYLTVRYRQFMGGNLIALNKSDDDDRYLVQHVIDGQLVKLVIVKSKEKIISVVDNERSIDDEDDYDRLTTKCLPYLRYKHEGFKSRHVDEDNPLTIYYESGFCVETNV